MLKGLISSLHTLMTTGNGPLARDWLDQISHIENIERIEIIRPNGQEAFLDLETLDRVNEFLGEKAFARKALPGRMVNDIQKADLKIASSGVTVQIKEISSHSLTTLFPIMTGENCLSCHGYDDSPLRGILRITTSLAGAQASIENSRNESILLGGGALLFMGILLFFLVRQLVIVPLLEVADVALRVSEGDLEARAEETRSDEIGLMAGAFNRMTSQLAGNLLRYRSLSAYYNKILDHLTNGVAVYDKNMKIKYANKAMEEVTGFSAEMILGKRCIDLCPEEFHNDYCGDCFKDRAMRMGKNFTDIFPRLNQKGERWIARISIIPVFDEKGEVSEIVEVSEDITKDLKRQEEIKWLASIPEMTPIPIVELGPEGEVQYLNPATVSYLRKQGFGPEGVEKILPRGYKKAVRLCNQTGQSLDTVYHKKQGEVIIWMLYPNESNRNIRAYGVDMTEQVQSRKDLEKSEEKYRALFEESLDCVFITTKEGKWIDINPAGIKMLQYKNREELLTTNVKDFYVEEGGREKYQRIIEEKGFVQDFECKLRGKSGKEMFVHITANAVFDSKGKVIAYRGIMRDITENKEAEEKLHYMASHDTLTGIPNRVLFLERVDQALTLAKRSSKMVAVLFLDLDRFKAINDTLGHDTGDLLLKEVAKRLLSMIRETDTVGRFGGDEFTVVLPGLDSPKDAARIAGKILQTMVPPFLIVGAELFLTTSIGISLYPGDGQEKEELLKTADIAMYRAKEEGRNNFQLFTPSMNDNTIKNLAFERALRMGLEKKEFHLYFQPQIHVESGKVVGLTVLPRWIHGRQEIASPSDFLSLAEETGLVLSLGEFVLREASSQNRRWREQGLTILPLSVKLSSGQFHHSQFLSFIEDLFEKSTLEPAYLEIEVTENTIMENEENSSLVLSHLADKGVKLAVGNFGKGYSSLKSMKLSPLSRIRSESSLLLIGEAEHHPPLGKTVVALAQSMEIELVATEVKNPAEGGSLKNLGCSLMEGPLFSSPLSTEEATVLLAKQRSFNVSF